VHEKARLNMRGVRMCWCGEMNGSAAYGMEMLGRRFAQRRIRTMTAV